MFKRLHDSPCARPGKTRFVLSALLLGLTVASCSESGAGSAEREASGAGGAPGTGGAPATGGALGQSGGSGGSLASGGSPDMPTGGANSGGNSATGGSGGAASSGGVGSGGMDVGSGGQAQALEWLPSWATSIQGLEDKPDHIPPIPLSGNTLRQFIWPTYSGETVRIQLSNEKGEAPMEIAQVHIARAATSANPGDSGGDIDAATDVALTFDGASSVTIPAGETVWSDGVEFPLQKIELTAISIQFGAQTPDEITNHPGSRSTSYFVSGDAVAQPQLADAQTRDRWYVINALEVMAPSDAFAIAVLGDSITDGYGVLNAFERWPDYLTLAIDADPMLTGRCSVLNFGMGGNELTVSGVDQDSGLVRFGRDVLTRPKIEYLIVFEGVNDIQSSGVLAQPIIDTYMDIVSQAQAAGMTVYGSTITPMSEDNAVRNAVNESIRNGGYFDAVIDMDAAVRDANQPDNWASPFELDGLHPNVAGYEVMGNAVDLSLFY